MMFYLVSVQIHHRADLFSCWHFWLFALHVESLSIRWSCTDREQSSFLLFRLIFFSNFSRPLLPTFLAAWPRQVCVRLLPLVGLVTFLRKWREAWRFYEFDSSSLWVFVFYVHVYIGQSRSHSDLWVWLVGMGFFPVGVVVAVSFALCFSSSLSSHQSIQVGLQLLKAKNQTLSALIAFIIKRLDTTLDFSWNEDT